MSGYTALREDQILRVDHFLGKEPVIELEYLRFANLALVEVWDKKAEVFRAMPAADPHRYVCGQYDGYTDVPGVAKGSRTETFIALRLEIDNWRWTGVPIFLRAGKALA